MFEWSDEGKKLLETISEEIVFSGGVERVRKKIYAEWGWYFKENGRSIKKNHWTEVDLMMLVQLSREGKSQAHIGFLLRRSTDAVGAKLREMTRKHENNQDSL